MNRSNLNQMLHKLKKVEEHLKIQTEMLFQTLCIKLFHLFKREVNQKKF